MATVNLIDIAKRVGSLTILDQVNLSINKGEFIVVVGPSGCGKSTLLRLIAGLDSLSFGQILINDTCVNRIPPAKRDMAMVFQNYALYPHMTVFDNMAYGLKMRGYKKDVIQKKVTDAAHLLQLTPYLERKPQALSGGQKQRVAMGRAIVRSPAVYLFDEPLSNLDAKLRTEMRHEIKKLHQEFNTTSLYVTHDQTEAMTMAERIVVLNQGLVEQIGTPQQLYQKPGSIFVAGFTGHYPINFFKGHLDKVANLIHTGVGNFKAPKCTHLLEHNAALVLAIRPEHLQLCSENAEDALAITVDFVDDMGADKLIQARSMGNSSELLNVRVQSDVSVANQTFYVSFPREKLHLFDEQTGQRIGDWCE